MSAEEVTINLEGRIAALELLMRDLFLDMLERTDTPGKPGETVSTAEKVGMYRHGLMSTLQNLSRPIGEREDEVWEATVIALEEAFHNAKIRAEAADSARER